MYYRGMLSDRQGEPLFLGTTNSSLHDYAHGRQHAGVKATMAQYNEKRGEASRALECLR